MKGKVHYVYPESHHLYGVCCDACHKVIDLNKHAYELNGVPGCSIVSVVLCSECINDIAWDMDLFDSFIDH